MAWIHWSDRKGILCDGKRICRDTEARDQRLKTSSEVKNRPRQLHWHRSYRVLPCFPPVHVCTSLPPQEWPQVPQYQHIYSLAQFYDTHWHTHVTSQNKATEKSSRLTGNFFPLSWIRSPAPGLFSTIVLFLWNTVGLICFCVHAVQSFFLFLFFNLGMIALQCCIVFCYTSHESATGIHRSPPSWTPFSPPTPLHRARWSQSTELTSLSHTAHSHLLSALHMVMCMLPYYSLNSSHPLLPPLCPQVCALCLHLHCVCVPSHFSHVQLFVSLWPIAHQAPLFLGIPRQEHWSGLPCPPPGDLPNPRIEPRPLCLLQWQAGSLPPAPPSIAALQVGSSVPSF